MTDDTIDKLHRHMELSQTLGAPIEAIPAKAVAIIELIQPWLVKHTTPREAGIVVAVVYAYFASILTIDTNGDKEQACANAHSLLDAAINIVSDVDIASEE